MADNPLCRKLQIKPGKALAVVGAPAGFLGALKPLPEGVRRSATLRANADVILGFVRTRRQALAGARKWKRRLAEGGILWICYPKLTSSAAGELSRDVLWRDLEPLGMRPVAMIAIDGTWSAMRVKIAG